MFIHSRIKYSILLIIPLILLILLPADSLADAYRIPKKSGIDNEAIEACKQAIKANPADADAHYILGNTYGESGMYNEAIEPFKQAIRIDPDYADAHYNLGYAYILLNDRDSALEQYKILKSLDPELANKLFNLIYE